MPQASVTARIDTLTPDLFRLRAQNGRLCFSLDRHPPREGCEVFCDKPASNFEAIELMRGASLHVGEFLCAQPNSFAFEVNSRQICFSFAELGSTATRMQVGGRTLAELVHGPGQLTASYLPEARGEWRAQAGGCRILTLCVDPGQFSPLWLEFGQGLPAQLLALARGRNPAPFYSGMAMTPAMQEALRCLRRCPASGSAKRLYMECKTMELLILMLARLADAGDGDGRRVPLSLADRERIYAARDILLDRMEDPPSLSQLAREVGVNEFKLKRGFRQIFGDTPYGVLRDVRLNKAREYLESGAMNVCEACVAVGYSNPGNFIGLFKKRFGSTPGDMRQHAMRRPAAG
jgi:AraC-like DNA-binding protein